MGMTKTALHTWFIIQPQERFSSTGLQNSSQGVLLNIRHRLTFQCHGERYVSSQSKQNIADQASENTHEPQTETENQSSAQTEGGDQSMHYPKRNRRAPQYLTDYVSAVECDD